MILCSSRGSAPDPTTSAGANTSAGGRDLGWGRGCPAAQGPLGFLPSPPHLPPDLPPPAAGPARKRDRNLRGRTGSRAAESPKLAPCRGPAVPWGPAPARRGGTGPGRAGSWPRSRPRSGPSRCPRHRRGRAAPQRPPGHIPRCRSFPSSRPGHRRCPHTEPPGLRPQPASLPKTFSGAGRSRLRADPSSNSPPPTQLGDGDITSERILPAGQAGERFTVTLLHGSMCQRHWEEYFDKLTLIKHTADKCPGIRFCSLLQSLLRV